MGTEAGGLWGTPIYQGDTVSLDTAAGEVDSSGGKEKRPSLPRDSARRGLWGIHRLIASASSLLTGASAARAALEPLGESRTTLP